MGPILNRGNRRINRVAIEKLEIAANDRVLEVGFGGGGAIAHVLRSTDARVIGVEVSEPMLRGAKQRFRKELTAGRLELLRASVEAMPFPDAAFDRALSVNAIYFWPDTERGLTEMLRVLRPGGRVMLATFAAERMRARSYTREAFRFFEDAELDRLLRQAGYERVGVERHGRFVISAGHKSDLAP
jgi:ubiquinone/menaquinone biosynthesis C-methylase UbiE